MMTPLTNKQQLATALVLGAGLAVGAATLPTEAHAQTCSGTSCTVTDSEDNNANQNQNLNNIRIQSPKTHFGVNLNLDLGVKSVTTPDLASADCMISHVNAETPSFVGQIFQGSKASGYTFTDYDCKAMNNVGDLIRTGRHAEALLILKQASPSVHSALSPHGQYAVYCARDGRPMHSEALVQVQMAEIFKEAHKEKKQVDPRDVLCGEKPNTTQIPPAPAATPTPPQAPTPVTKPAVKKLTPEEQAIRKCRASAWKRIAGQCTADPTSVFNYGQNKDAGKPVTPQPQK